MVIPHGGSRGHGPGRVPRVDAYRRPRALNRRLPHRSDVFPGVGSQGGVCYFLWDRDNPGPCASPRTYKTSRPSTLPATLEEGDVFIRFNEGLSILRRSLLSRRGSVTLLTNLRFMKWLARSARLGSTATLGAKRRTPGNDALGLQERWEWGSSQDRKSRRNDRSSTSGKCSLAAPLPDRQQRHLPAQDHQHTIHRRARKHLSWTYMLHRPVRL